MSPADLRSRLEALLPGLEFLEASDRLCLTLPAERLLDVAALLRRTPELAFDGAERSADILAAMATGSDDE